MWPVKCIHIKSFDTCPKTCSGDQDWCSFYSPGSGSYHDVLTSSISLSDLISSSISSLLIKSLNSPSRTDANLILLFASLFEPCFNMRHQRKSLTQGIVTEILNMDYSVHSCAILSFGFCSTNVRWIKILFRILVVTIKHKGCIKSDLLREGGLYTL